MKHDDERMHIHETEQGNDYIEEMEMTSCSNYIYLDILSNDNNSESTILERLSLLLCQCGMKDDLVCW